MHITNLNRRTSAATHSTHPARQLRAAPGRHASSRVPDPVDPTGRGSGGGREGTGRSGAQRRCAPATATGARTRPGVGRRVRADVARRSGRRQKLITDTAYRHRSRLKRAHFHVASVCRSLTSCSRGPSLPIARHETSSSTKLGPTSSSRYIRCRDDAGEHAAGLEAARPQSAPKLLPTRTPLTLTSQEMGSYELLGCNAPLVAEICSRRGSNSRQLAWIRCE